MAPDPLPAWDDLRRQMPVTAHWAYFDHAAVSPLPAPTRARLTEWADDACQHGVAHWDRWAAWVDDARRLGAALVGAELDEIALVRNTTEGISLVAEGYPWQPGDNVVTLDTEFPSNRLPWQNLASRGVETRLVAAAHDSVDLAALAAACDARTRIVSVSWVGYAAGYRLDLDAVCEIARRTGTLVMVDAIQALGMFPLDVRATPIDFLAADGHKWLLGPEGAGLLYIRREQLERLRPLGVGWNSVEQSGDFSRLDVTLKASAARYEGGSYNLAGIGGLAASLELLVRWGPAAIGQRLIEVTDEACRRLERAGMIVRSCRDDGRASGIVAFDVPGRTPSSIRATCRRQGVLLNARAGHVRISPHAYTNEYDLDRLLEALADSA